RHPRRDPRPRRPRGARPPRAPAEGRRGRVRLSGHLRGGRGSRDERVRRAGARRRARARALGRRALPAGLRSPGGRRIVRMTARWRVLALAIGYFVAAEVGGVLSAPGHFATFWPPSGVLLAALLLEEPRRWPVLLLAVLPANLAFDLLQGHPITVSLAYWAGNSLEALAGATLVRRYAGI